MSHQLVVVTPENILTETLFCVKNTSDPGFLKKKIWFIERYAEGLQLKILKNELGKSIAFIEYIPAEYAWRPIDAAGYIFIHCMFVYSTNDKNKGIGTQLLNDCENHARSKGYKGVCTMTSEGSWIANKSLFMKNGYSVIEKKGRFELLVKKFSTQSSDPKLIDWTLNQRNYAGWNLIYADQCPWHEKSAQALKKTANEVGIDLKLIHITTLSEAKNAPSGFGTFSLVKDGMLVEDHYLSETRFRNILKKN